jgi:O-antigen ligase
LVAGVTVFSVLHVGSKLNNRVSNSGTNQGRLAVYTQTFDGAMKSPLFGYGAPRPQPTGADVSAQGTFGPSLGTQGQFWTILYSQGFVGTAFYLVGFITLAWRSRRAPTPALVWMHTITLMGLLEIIYYGFQLSEFTLYMVAAAIALRDLPARSHLAAPQRPERIVETLPVVARA